MKSFIFGIAVFFLIIYSVYKFIKNPKKGCGGNCENCIHECNSKKNKL